MKFFIDAGHNHSGADTGAQGFGLREQDVTWQVAEYVAQGLLALGQQVKLSRPNITDNLGADVSSSLAARAKMSDAFGADYCISIHCNAGGGTGCETFAYQNGGVGAKLAQAINRQIATRLGLRDRGVKFANYYMLRAPKAPAVLVETAFIDHAQDNELLRTKQKEFADAIVAGICEFAGIKGEEKKMSKEEQIALIKEKTGLQDESIAYLNSYIFRDALIEKLANAMK